ncbi:hypothetical protein COBT_003857, partial [Conglomerata obtusa]
MTFPKRRSSTIIITAPKKHKLSIKQVPNNLVLQEISIVQKDSLIDLMAMEKSNVNSVYQDGNEDSMTFFGGNEKVDESNTYLPMGEHIKEGEIEKVERHVSSEDKKLNEKNVIHSEKQDKINDESEIHNKNVVKGVEDVYAKNERNLINNTIEEHKKMVKNTEIRDKNIEKQENLINANIDDENVTFFGKDADDKINIVKDDKIIQENNNNHYVYGKIEFSIEENENKLLNQLQNANTIINSENNNNQNSNLIEIKNPAEKENQNINETMELSFFADKSIKNMYKSWIDTNDNKMKEDFLIN